MDDTSLSKRARHASLISACDMMMMKESRYRTYSERAWFRQLFCPNSSTLRDDTARFENDVDLKWSSSSGESVVRIMMLDLVI